MTSIRLQSIPRAQLLHLLDGAGDALAGMHVVDGALPPMHVLERALQWLDDGVPARWCAPRLVVSPDGGTVYGGCGFKGAPVDGCVEISYGIARPYRGRGLAGAALAALLEQAARSGEVREVVACIVPENLASRRVVEKFGFAMGEAFVDYDGEVAVRWRKRIG